MNTPGFKLYTLYICGFLFSILTIGIYWASVESNVIQGIKEMVALRWGVVTFLDFYIGATVIGVWICVLEKSIFRGCSLDPLHISIGKSSDFSLFNETCLEQ